MAAERAAARAAAEMLLRAATLPDGSTADVRVADGAIAEIAPAATLAAAGSTEVLDLRDHVLLPALVEPHAHLDKALTADRFEVPTGDLGAAISAWHAHRATLEHGDIAERARRAALLALAHGVTALR